MIMLFVKMTILCISGIANYQCIAIMHRLPKEELTPKKNIKQMDIAMVVSVLVDFFFCLLMIALGEHMPMYEAGIIEAIILFSWFPFWVFFSIIVVLRLRKRIEKYLATVEHNLSKLEVHHAIIISTYYIVATVVIKGFFALLMSVVWTV